MLYLCICLYIFTERVSKRPKLSAKLSAKKPKQQTINAILDPSAANKKYDKQGEVQQKFDMAMCTLLVRLSLPWALLDHEAYKDFWNVINPRYNLKTSTTFSKRKLPLLYAMTKKAIDAKVTKDLGYTTGVAFTCDHWTSKNMDPYLGMTMHYIDKDWQLVR